jgi:ADP-heptose:LPS heptosyltransferase
LGDIVHTFPAIAALRETFPTAQITWLTHPRWESLVAASNLATEVWAADTRSVKSLREIIQRIRAAKFTKAIDYQGLWKSAALPLLGGLATRIGFSSETIREWGVPILYTDRVRCVTTHIAEQNGELSQRAGAIKTVAPFELQIDREANDALCQFVKDQDVERYILLSPGGGWRSKCWPPDRFGLLCHRIRDTLNVRCIINYGPGEEDLVQGIRSAAGSAEPIACSGNMENLMAVAQNALCIVGGDTGPLLLAVELGTSSVGIYGPTDPRRNGPYPNVDLRNPPRHAANIVLRAPNAVRNHGRIDQTDPLILQISVEQVFAAVKTLVEAAA